jgi:gamma-glutamyltranspeptidase/glutathione hydrolase
MGHAHDHADLPPSSTASEGNVVLAFLGALAIAGGVLVISATRVDSHGDHADHAHHTAPSAAGRNGAVATAAPEASEAALEVLKKGGNAFDALVTASFVVSVVRPQSTGLGGGGFVVYHDAAKQVEGALDGRETAPAGAGPGMYLDAKGEVDRDKYTFGPTAAGVPGLVAMLWEVHQRLGSNNLPWSQLLDPAIRYARKGFPAPAPLVRQIIKYKAVLERYPASAQVFLPGGKVPRVGQLIKQPGLARTLELIRRHGKRGFYEGSVAQEIARSIAETGAEGSITAQDLAGYKLTAPEVVRGTYRGHAVVSFPPPSSGGVHLIQMLNILSGYDLAHEGHNSEQHVHLLAEAMRRAYADRSKLLADPAFVAVPVKGLISRTYADTLRKGIHSQMATPSSQVQGGVHVPSGNDTTHISIVDTHGNAVSSTQTINTGLGSCFVAGSTGVLLNNEMNDFTAKANVPNKFGLIQSEKNLPEPGKRPLSSMTPTIVFDAQNRVKAVIGSPGGPKIITTVLQVTSNLLDFQMTPVQAMAAPRVHHQWVPDKLILESPLGGLKGGLAARGHQVRLLSPKLGLGNAQIVVVGPSGERTAVSDPRGTGRPAAN